MLSVSCPGEAPKHEILEFADPDRNGFIYTLKFLRDAPRAPDHNTQTPTAAAGCPQDPAGATVTHPRQSSTHKPARDHIRAPRPTNPPTPRRQHSEHAHRKAAEMGTRRRLRQRPPQTEFAMAPKKQGGRGNGNANSKGKRYGKGVATVVDPKSSSSESFYDAVVASTAVAAKASEVAAIHFLPVASLGIIPYLPSFRKNLYPFILLAFIPWRPPICFFIFLVLRSSTR